MSVIPEKITLLYIEDDDSVADLTLEYLKAFKHTEFIVIYKRTLKEGLEYLNAECKIEESCEIDAILLDLVLPNSHGVDTFKKVHEKCDFLPIVIMSGHEEMACQCVKMGAQDYLLKAEITPGILIRSLKYSIERTNLEKKRKQSESKFKNLVEVSGAGMYGINLITGQFDYVNDVMCKQTGWTREEIMEMGPAGLLTEDSLMQWVQRWDDMKNKHSYSGPTEYEVKTKGGGTLWGLIVSEFVQDKDGNVIRANVVAIDITDKKLAEKAFEEQKSEVYSDLETRIIQWRGELETRENKRHEQLTQINNEILSMTRSNLVEAS